MQNENSDPSGRDQRTSFLLDAPVEKVWQVWTQPEHIKQWWGPKGFTNTIEKMLVEPGGEWIFTMQLHQGCHQVKLRCDFPIAHQAKIDEYLRILVYKCLTNLKEIRTVDYKMNESTWI